MNVRRRFLKGALRGAAALIAADTTSRVNSHHTYVGQGPSVAVESGQDDLIEKVQRRHWREQRRRNRIADAYHGQSPDIAALVSTSPVWRAVVQASRNDEQQTLADQLQDQIDAMKRKPLEAVEAWARGLIGETLK